MEFKVKIDGDTGAIIGWPKNGREMLKQRYPWKRVRIRITEIRSKASPEAHGYYHAVIKPAVVWRLCDLGNAINPYSKDDVAVVDRWLTNKFLRNGDEWVDANGEVHVFESSKAKASHEDLCNMEQDVIAWAADVLEIAIPDPDKDWKQTKQLSFVEVLEKDYPDIARRYRRDALTLQEDEI